MADEALALDVHAELDDRLVVIRQAKGAGIFELGITPSVASVLRGLIGAAPMGPCCRWTGSG
ncbi:hypothetical protein [Streptomyces sp. NPDC054756]